MKKTILALSILLTGSVEAQHPNHPLEQYIVDNPSYYPQYDFLRADDPNREYLKCYADYGTHLRELLDEIGNMSFYSGQYLALAKVKGVKVNKRIADRCKFWMSYFNHPVDPNQSPIARDIVGNASHWPSWPNTPGYGYPLSVGRIAWCQVNHDGAVQAISDLRNDIYYTKKKIKELLKK